jgi:hypothetical protein
MITSVLESTKNPNTNANVAAILLNSGLHPNLIAQAAMKTQKTYEPFEYESLITPTIDSFERHDVSQVAAMASMAAMNPYWDPAYTAIQTEYEQPQFPTGGLGDNYVFDSGNVLLGYQPYDYVDTNNQQNIW